jgi:uncharacterized protein (UPF0333 family)
MIVIEECSEDAINEREIYWIAYHRESNPNLKNMTIGGTGGQTSDGNPTTVYCSNGKKYPSIRSAAEELGIHVS